MVLTRGGGSDQEFEGEWQVQVEVGDEVNGHVVSIVCNEHRLKTATAAQFS